MTNEGLAYCSVFTNNPFCITKLIEFLLSSLLFVGILYTLISRYLHERQINFFVLISILMIVCLFCNMAFTLFHNIVAFYYLQTFLYNFYFLSIIYQVALKMTKHANLSKKYMVTWTCFFVAFLLINLAIDIDYSIQMSEAYCKQIGYLIMNSLGIIFSIFLIVLNCCYYKIQHEKLRSIIGHQNSTNKTNYKNPLPFMWAWIGTNIFSQIASFSQTLYFTISSSKCKFSESQVTNSIVKLLFSIICFHLGLFATLIFFRSKYSNTNQYQGRSSVRKDSMEQNGGLQLITIQTHKEDLLKL